MSVHRFLPSFTRPPGSRRRGRVWRLATRAARVGGVLVLTVAATVLVVTVADSAAFAAEPGAPVLLAAPANLEAVVENLRLWLFGLLVGVATLFLTLGSVRLIAANGDPTEAEKGKSALKSAALGYALALLAPLIVTIVGSWVA